MMIYINIKSSQQLKNNVQWAQEVAKNDWGSFVGCTDRSTTLSWIHLARGSEHLRAPAGKATAYTLL